MDFRLGEAANYPIYLAEPGTGAPMLGVSTPTITSVLYGPGSTVAVASFSSASSAGGGWYYVALTTTNLALPGRYRLDVTCPAAGMTAVPHNFTVGEPIAGSWRVRDVLASIIRGTGGSVRPSTSIDNFTVTDDYWIGAVGGTASEDLSGTEVVILDPALSSMWTNWPHGRVVSFNGTTGALTLNRSTFIAGDATRRQYALTNVLGTGFSWEQILDELRVAHDEIAPTVLVSDSVSTTVADNQLEYDIPQGMLSVAGLYTRQQGDLPADQWDDLAGRYSVLPDRRKLRLEDGLALSPGASLRIEGAVRAELSVLGSGWTDIRGAYLRDRVIFGLFSKSPNATHQRAAGAIYANLVRTGDPKRPRLAGEVRIG